MFYKTFKERGLHYQYSKYYNPEITLSIFPGQVNVILTLLAVCHNVTKLDAN